jgi:hypothetical protein
MFSKKTATIAVISHSLRLMGGRIFLMKYVSCSMVGDVSSRATTNILPRRTPDRLHDGQINICSRKTTVHFHTLENLLPSVLIIIGWVKERNCYAQKYKKL